MATAKCVGFTITAVALGTSFIIWRRKRSRCKRRIRAFICWLPSRSFISSLMSCLLMRRSCLWRCICRIRSTVPNPSLHLLVAFQVLHFLLDVLLAHAQVLFVAVHLPDQVHC